MYSLYIQYLNNNKINTRKVADWISKSNYNIIYKSITDGKPLNWNDINPQSENISEKKSSDIENCSRYNYTLFWNIIDKLNWIDKDDNILSSVYINKKLTLVEINVLKSNFDYFITKLKNIFNQNDLVLNLSKKDNYDFLSHIVGKG